MSEASDRGASPQFSYNEFTQVKHRKKRRGRTREDRPIITLVVQLYQQLGQDDWMDECRRILQESLKDKPLGVREILCLGLGSPSSSLNARAQLAFLLCMSDHLNIERGNVLVYDPVLTAEDIALLQELRVRVLIENKNAEYPVEKPTLCFMPHCDLELYENMIKANWDPGRLAKLVLVANRLVDYVESWPGHKLEAVAPHLYRLAPSLKCNSLPTSTAWPNAFNNTAIQFVGASDSLHFLNGG